MSYLVYVEAWKYTNLSSIYVGQYPESIQFRLSDSRFSGWHFVVNNLLSLTMQECFRCEGKGVSTNCRINRRTNGSRHNKFIIFDIKSQFWKALMMDIFLLLQQQYFVLDRRACPSRPITNILVRLREHVWVEPWSRDQADPEHFMPRLWRTSCYQILLRTLCGLCQFYINQRVLTIDDVNL